MSNRRVKSLGVDEDDLDYDDNYEDEYDVEPEVSVEDKRQLQEGTVKVKQQLGSLYKVSDQEIQDALWNFYYDISKTVALIKSKHKPRSAPATAQSKPVSSKPKAQPKSAPTTITDGVDNLSIEESKPKVRRKNIDVIAEYNKKTHKNAANFVVIGHVDAGKSTLMGRLLYDLKAIDQRTIDKYQREAETIGKGSFALAWALDQGSEERERGVTIDIAAHPFSASKTQFTILDAPGHADFVPNMIAGAAQADFAVLVVDASTGAFESGLKGQTREHALLAKSIGVNRLIVAVNKMDTQSWSQSRFEDIKAQLSTLLKSANFTSLTFIPCSGLQGQNILTPITATSSVSSWYKSAPYNNETLVDALDAFEPTAHALDKPLRMTISDVFRGGIQNPLSVSGRMDSGTLQVGDQILIQPSGETATIRALEVDADDSISPSTGIEATDPDSPSDSTQYAVAGQTPILHLTDIDPIHIRTGDVLCQPGSDAVKNITSFTASILTFTHITPMTVDLHKGRLHVPARIKTLVGVLDKKTGEIIKKRPKIVGAEEAVKVKVELDEEGGKGVPIEKGARIVLRSGGTSIAAGIVE